MSNARNAFVNFDFGFETERLAFAFNKLKHEEIVTNIHSNNEKLAKFLDLSSQVGALHSNVPQRPKRPVAKHMLQYWRHAERVYSLLKSAWGCACQDTHHAQLWLQHRSSPTFEFCLCVLFSLRPTVQCAWKEHMLKVEKLQRSPSILSQASSPSASVVQPADTSMKHLTKKSFVSSIKAKYETIRSSLAYLS